MKKQFYLLSIGIIVLLTSCEFKSGDSSNSEVLAEIDDLCVVNSADITNENINLTIFLDLSDWIAPENRKNKSIPTQEYCVGYIQSCASALVGSMVKIPLPSLDARIRVIAEPTPNQNDLNELIGDLNVQFDKSNLTIEDLENFVESYKEKSEQLYQYALKEQKFPGSDLFTFIDSKVTGKAIEPKHKNVLVIISDGYMYFEDNLRNIDGKTSYITASKIKEFGLITSSWKTIYQADKRGFVPLSKNYEDLHVLLVGLNPNVQSNDYEREVLKKYWTDWLGPSVADFDIIEIDLPSSVNEQIQEFILK